MPSPWSKIGPFALLSLGSFLLASFLLFLLIWNSDTLANLGFTGKLYYIILLPLGLAVAGFLFGVLQSYASYTGKQFGGHLVLSGPIVVFLLVVVLGFKLVPDHSTFPVTVYVHGTKGPQDIALRNSGEVYMDLDGWRHHVPIGDQGQAYFPAIPANFQGRSVPAWIESDKFESVGAAAKVHL